jgi:deazaflavin-dependent oxidoreductase (nitroreductase family)
MTTPAKDARTHYLAPDRFTRHVMNPVLDLAMRLGLSFKGSRVLEHVGRRSGTLHHTPVNLLSYEGQEYLVAPRGETEWVRNVRADGGRVVLILGRRRAERHAEEVPAAARVALLRAYLARWQSEVGRFFEGVGPESSDEEIAGIAERHPVFVLR